MIYKFPTSNPNDIPVLDYSGGSPQNSVMCEERSDKERDYNSSVGVHSDQNHVSDWYFSHDCLDNEEKQKEEPQPELPPPGD
eukprot:SAG22_NODE_1271_length_4929_cov_4.159420_2_plen_82_part_00